MYATAAAKSLQLCLPLCNPIDGSPPGSPIPGILQARTLEWVAIFFSNAWKWKVKVKSLSRVWLLVTSCTAAYQAPPSMGFSRQEYWTRMSFCLLCALHNKCLFPVVIKNHYFVFKILIYVKLLWESWHVKLTTSPLYTGVIIPKNY